MAIAVFSGITYRNLANSISFNHSELVLSGSLFTLIIFLSTIQARSHNREHNCCLHPIFK